MKYCKTRQDILKVLIDREIDVNRSKLAKWRNDLDVYNLV